MYCANSITSRCTDGQMKWKRKACSTKYCQEGGGGNTETQ